MAGELKKLFADRCSYSSSWLQVKLSGKGLGDDQMVALGRFLTELLRGAAAGTAGGKAEPPREICANLELAENSIGSAGLVAVLDSLQRCNVSCKCLKLYKNKIGDDGGVRLARMIASQASVVEELHLSHNLLTQRSLVALCMTMGKHDGYPALGRNRLYIPCWLRMEYNNISRPLEVVQALKRDGEVSICLAEDRDQCGPWRCIHAGRTQQGVPKVHLFTIHVQSRTHRPSPQDDVELREELRRWGVRGGPPPPSVRPAVARAPGAPGALPGPAVRPAAKAAPGSAPTPTSTGRGWGAPAGGAAVWPAAGEEAEVEATPEPKPAAEAVEADESEKDAHPAATEQKGENGCSAANSSPAAPGDKPAAARPGGYPAEPCGTPEVNTAASPVRHRAWDVPLKKDVVEAAAAPAGAAKAGAPAGKAAASNGVSAPKAASAGASVNGASAASAKAKGAPSTAEPKGKAPAPTNPPSVGAPAPSAAPPAVVAGAKAAAGGAADAAAPAGGVDAQRSSKFLDRFGARRIAPQQLETNDGHHDCVLCGFVMVKPVMTTCCHLFCEACFRHYVSEEVSKMKSKAGGAAVPLIPCPKDGCSEQLRKQDITLLEKAQEAKVGAAALLLRLRNNLRVRCVHHSALVDCAFGQDANRIMRTRQIKCDWVGDLAAYDDHIAKCPVERCLVPGAEPADSPSEAAAPATAAKAGTPAAATAKAKAEPPAAASPEKKPPSKAAAAPPGAEAGKAAARTDDAIAEGGEVRVARFDYQPQEADKAQIALKANDLVRVFEVTSTGWAAGVRLSKKTKEEVGDAGWFPAAYLSPQGPAAAEAA
eukprot:TRINITY_DN6400_c3_g1_i1.p1 TRINITY_DN6400_c3_g1~~TRINITY_DN6400_c3_g1_i1.p1  ORF type:complete len:823 (-),score=174.34 TRINITY_DN6400_c3_g1_i1:319-2787(-)